jgi:phenylalanine-4-hydroxylase
MINKILSRLPAHLKEFIVEQHYDEYTAQNHAVWRYVMRKNIVYLKGVAHPSYLEGLKKTGISIDKIPRLEDMNKILAEIGWAAVTVDGFIPPNAFMEFQAYNTLVIAADIRTIDHIAYTPAPDIIHEAAGHAPIIANPEYAEYLRRFGEIGAKAISSGKDHELFEAIRHLSIIKEDPNTSDKEVLEAESRIEHISQNMGEPSEMSKIRNLHWWTVEYGLIGTVDAPKIYGAGLLSSIGESKWCMGDQVRKLPYSIAAAEVSFDITKPQPQLFVSPDFAYLSLVLEEFANSMSLRRGGIQGIRKLISSKNLGTIELSTGIQISGIFSEVREDKNGDPVYFKTFGPTALAFKNKEIIGHDKAYHRDGFGSPLGKLKGINLAIEDMSPKDLEAYRIYEGKRARLEFEGDIVVEGEIITGKRNLQGKIILISFKDCMVKQGDEVLFHPSWGTYEMAIGATVISAFAGVADPGNYGISYEAPAEKTHKIHYNPAQRKLHGLYQEVRDIREKGFDPQSTVRLEQIFNTLETDYPTEWLLALEIAELVSEPDHLKLKNRVSAFLKNLAGDPGYKELIGNGIS